MQSGNRNVPSVERRPPRDTALHHRSLVPPSSGAARAMRSPWNVGGAAAAVLCALLQLIAGSGCRRVTFPSDTDASSPSSYRLPTVTSPVSYELLFAPDLRGAGSTFAGVTRITIAAAARTDLITLNLDELDVTAVTVTDVAATTTVTAVAVAVTDAVYLADCERLEIRLADHLLPGRMYLVTIAYRGAIRDDRTGLFMASYAEDNTTKWMAVTDFQPSAARKAFPCYDEPQFKARFDIAVVRKKNQTVLSNMPIKKIEISPDNETEVVYFETTPPMSTYLVAFYIGELVAIENDANITIYSRKEFSDQTEYVGKGASKYIRVMEEYTGIRYMLPKMDLLAVPGFNDGAMENWGMNTYKEKYLLLREESKTVMKMEAIQGLQHEFAHQWFGNLVTCSWWKHLWLNEGFATYFQYFATGMVKTEWHMEELFVLEVHQVTLDYDQSFSRSISGMDNDENKLDEFFDTITYYKSASVLRMLKFLVTEDLFKLSVRDYLNTKKESFAEPNDLYASFDRVLFDNNYTIGNELSVTEFMSNWTLQSGYPVIHVTKNETTNTFSVTQRRFLTKKKRDIVSDPTAAWHVGLTYTTESSKNFSRTSPSAWTNKTSRTTVIPAPPNSGWYLFNVQSSGLYRVNYDIDNWNALIKQLYDAHTEVHVLNRAQLIDDAFALAQAGILNYTMLLNLSKYLRKENETLPWYSAMNGFLYLIEMMPRNNAGYDGFKEYVSKLVGAMFNKLDDLVSKGNSDATVNRAWDEFSKWACRLDNTNCTSRAMEYFKKWEAGEKIPDDIKDVAFCVGVKRSNGSDTFDRMFNLYKTTKSISEMSSAEEALLCTTNNTQLTEYYRYKLRFIHRPIQKHDESFTSLLFTKPFDALFEFITVHVNNFLKELFSGNGFADSVYSILFAYNVKMDSYRFLINAYAEEITLWLHENKENYP